MEQKGNKVYLFNFFCKRSRGIYSDSLVPKIVKLSRIQFLVFFFIYLEKATHLFIMERKVALLDF